MSTNQKGYTLIELIMVLFLMSIMMSGSMTIGSKMLHEVRLKSKANEVVAGLEYIKQSAVATGQQYNVFCFSNKVLVRKGMDTPLYTIQLGNGIKIPDGITGQWIRFRGTMAPCDGAATIKLDDQALGKRVRITVGVGTGKVRIYYETL